MRILKFQILSILFFLVAGPAWSAPPFKPAPKRTATSIDPAAEVRATLAAEFESYVRSHINLSARFEGEVNSILNPNTALTRKLLKLTSEKIQSGQISLPSRDQWDAELIFNAFDQSVSAELETVGDRQIVGLYETILGHAQRALDSSHETAVSTEVRADLVIAESKILAALAAGLTEPKEIFEKLSPAVRATVAQFQLYSPLGSPRNKIWEQWPLMKATTSESEIFSIPANPELSMSVTGRYARYLESRGHKLTEIIRYLRETVKIPELSGLSSDDLKFVFKAATLLGVYDSSMVIPALKASKFRTSLDMAKKLKDAADSIYRTTLERLQQYAATATLKPATQSFPFSQWNPRKGYKVSIAAPHTLTLTTDAPETVNVDGSKNSGPDLRISEGSIEIVRSSNQVDTDLSAREFLFRSADLVRESRSIHRNQNQADIIVNPEAALTRMTLVDFSNWLENKKLKVRINGEFTKSLLAQVLEKYFSISVKNDPVLLAHQDLLVDIARRNRAESHREFSTQDERLVRDLHTKYLAYTAAGITDLSVLKRDLPSLDFLPLFENGRVSEVFRHWYLYEGSDIDRFSKVVRHSELSRLIQMIKDIPVTEIVPNQTPEELLEREKAGFGPKRQTVGTLSENDITAFLEKAIPYEQIPGATESMPNGRARARLTPSQIRGIIQIIVNRPLADFDQVLSAAQNSDRMSGQPIQGISKQTYQYLRTQIAFWTRIMRQSNGTSDCIAKVRQFAPSASLPK